MAVGNKKAPGQVLQEELTVWADPDDKSKPAPRRTRKVFAGYTPPRRREPDPEEAEGLEDED